jgi:hypothetical protein
MEMKDTHSWRKVMSLKVLFFEENAFCQGKCVEVPPWVDLQGMGFSLGKCDGC